VLCVALSTALRPFTPTAPPEDRSIWLQPGPSGWQLTLGGVGSGPLRASTGDRRASGTSGSATGLSPEPGDADPVRSAEDGVAVGPVSREQPGDAQPVAAGPTKVGEYVPKLDDVTELFPEELVAGAAPAPLEATVTASASGSSATSANRNRRCMTFLHSGETHKPGM
jgi:hypothetical protein